MARALFQKEEGEFYPIFEEIDYEGEGYPAIEQSIGNEYVMRKTIAQRLMEDPNPEIALKETPTVPSIGDGYDRPDIPNYKRTGYLKETSITHHVLREFMTGMVNALFWSGAASSDEFSDEEHEEEEVNMVKADVCDSAQGQSEGESWLFDTGATVHVTPNEFLLFNVQECAVKISVAQGTVVVARKQGDIKIKGSGGTTLILTDVLYVPTFTTNIISGSRLVNKSGCMVKIQKKNAEIRNDKGGFIRMEYNPKGQLWFIRGTRVPVFKNEQRVYNTLNTTTEKRFNANLPKRGTKSKMNVNNNEKCEFVTIPALPQTPRENCEKISVLKRVSGTSNPQRKDCHHKVHTRNNQGVTTVRESKQLTYMEQPQRTPKQFFKDVNKKTNAPRPKGPNTRTSLLRMDINEAHQKFGHLSEGVLRRSMKYHGYELTGELRTCAACALFKARARPLAKVTKMLAYRPGERIYMDTKGPFPATLSGHTYWIKFTNTVA